MSKGNLETKPETPSAKKKAALGLKALSQIAEVGSKVAKGARMKAAAVILGLIAIIALQASSFFESADKSEQEETANDPPQTPEEQEQAMNENSEGEIK